MPPKPKKNPQDATLRNVRALHKRIDAADQRAEASVLFYGSMTESIARRLDSVTQRLDDLEKKLGK